MQVIVDNQEIDCSLQAGSADEFAGAFAEFARKNNRLVVGQDLTGWPYTVSIQTDDLKERVRSIGGKLLAVTGTFGLEHLDVAAAVRGADPAAAEKLNELGETWATVVDATGCLQILLGGSLPIEELADEVNQKLEVMANESDPAAMADGVEQLAEHAARWHDAIDAAKRGGAWE